MPAFPQYRIAFALLTFVKCFRFFVRKQVQYVASFFAFGQRCALFYVQHFGAGTFGVSKHMQLRNIKPIDKLTRSLEKFGSLATHAYYYIHANKCMWHQLLDKLHFMGKVFAVVFAFHKLKHFVGTRLQRNMEMGHNAFAGLNVFDDFVGQQVGLNRRNTETHIALDIVQRFHKIEKILVGMHAEIANVNPRKHYFAGSCIDGLHRSFHRFGYRCATAAATCKGNCAVSAIIIATILHFQEIAGAVVARTRRFKFPDLIYLCCMHFGRFLFVDVAYII